MSARAASTRPRGAEPLRPGVWSVPSSRPGELPYTVHWNGTRGTCTCPGFTRWGTGCKHLEYVRMVAGAQPAPGREFVVQSPTRALTRVPPAEPVALEPLGTFQPMTPAEAIAFAKALMPAAGFLPKKIENAGQLLAIIMTGQELAVGPMASIRHISSVEGKPDLSAELVLALIRRAYGQQVIRIAETTADHATVEWRQAGWEGLQSLTWTIKDAERAGLLRKDNWAHYPAAMLRARAVKAVARMAFPEVALGFDPAVEDPAVEQIDPPRLVDAGSAGEGEAAREADPRTLEGTCAVCGAVGTVYEAGTLYDVGEGRVCVDRQACRRRAGALRVRAAETAPPPGLLTAAELAAGGPESGAAGIVGEVVGIAACAICGVTGEAVYDGEMYVCADRAACEGRPDAPAAAPVAAPTSDSPGAAPAPSEDLQAIRAHLTRTGVAEAAYVDQYGKPLDRLGPAELREIKHDLSRRPNAKGRADVHRPLTPDEAF